MLRPGGENLLVLQLLHAGGGGHRHGDDDVVDVEGALTSPPLDRLLLGGGTKGLVSKTGLLFNDPAGFKDGLRTGVLRRPWLPAPRGTAFSEDVDSWRGRGL